MAALKVGDYVQALEISPHHVGHIGRVTDCGDFGVWVYFDQPYVNSSTPIGERYFRDFEVRKVSPLEVLALEAPR